MFNWIIIVLHVFIIKVLKGSEGFLRFPGGQLQKKHVQCRHAGEFLKQTHAGIKYSYEDCSRINFLLELIHQN